jgi:predicted nucleic acid-binding protein
VADVLCDASVVVKWFHAEGESEVAEARAILEAHVAGELTARVLDLTFYEVGNVAATALLWDGARIAGQLDDLELLLGDAIVLAAPVRSAAAQVAAAHRLTFYDAAYWAAAELLGCELVTADRRLLAAGAGKSSTELCAAFGLTVR